MHDQSKPDSQNPPPGNTHFLPFVAPCRYLHIEAPRRWIRLGVSDLKRASGKGLFYGFMALILCYGVAYAGLKISGPLVLLTILSGLTLIGPIMAIGLYSISRQLQNGLVPEFGYCFRDSTRGLGNLGLFASILIVLFLVWIHVGHLLHLFFPAGGLMSDRLDLVFFFGVGSAVGPCLRW